MVLALAIVNLILFAVNITIFVFDSRKGVNLIAGGANAVAFLFCMAAA